MKNAFTVDLEDWFCSHNLKATIQYEDWDKLESRVERNTFALLDLLSKSNVKATFFALGWIAERFPGLIKAIYREGHEIASHGYAHRQITLQDRGDFEQDIEQSVHILESITGRKPEGYRAPAFSVTSKTQWALPILKDHGFVYDSSIYPFGAHPEYGNGQVPVDIHINHNLIEVPLSCVTIGRLRFPCSGGAYLRFYPARFFLALVRALVKQGRPFIFYIHPWEIEKNPPKAKVSLLRSIRHYYNTRSTYEKIEKLLDEFEFTTVKNVLNQR